jgi:hypothetical protein
VIRERGRAMSDDVQGNIVENSVGLDALYRSVHKYTPPTYGLKHRWGGHLLWLWKQQQSVMKAMQTSLNHK